MLSFMQEPPGITLRDYQQAAFENVKTAFQSAPGAMVRLPTGCGKTYTAGMVAKWWVRRGPNYRVMVLCHETQLVWQFMNELRDVTGIQPAVEQGSAKVGVRGTPQIVVASRNSLAERVVVDMDGNENRVSRLGKFDWHDNWLLIVDEAHRYSRGLKLCGHIFEYFEQNPESRRLGITATPWRRDGISLQTLFPEIASDYRLWSAKSEPNAVADGLAVPYENHYITVEGVDFKNLKVSSGDFREGTTACRPSLRK